MLENVYNNRTYNVETIANNPINYNNNKVTTSKTPVKPKHTATTELIKPKTYLSKYLVELNNSVDCSISGIVRLRLKRSFDGIFLLFLAILISLPKSTSGNGILIRGRSQKQYSSGFDTKKLERRKRSLARSSLNDRLVLELYLANDLTRYNQYGGEKVADVVRSSKEIANRANLLFQPLGITVVLVGVEVWTDGDKISITEDLDLTLKNWMQYRSTYISDHNDAAFLLTRVDFGYHKYGKANEDSVCSQSDSVGVLRVLDDRSEVTGSMLAHYIGRVLNISVDTPECQCNDSKCIMDSQLATILGPEKFSQCSIEQMESSLKKGSEICLRNLPQVLDQYLSVCGNGILEDNEECDCGRLPTHICNQKCCDAEKCTLKGQCAHGDCCQIESCTLKKSSHLCREKSLKVCDIEEYCNGESSVCPVDSYVQDGTKCEINGKAGSCFGGQCTNRNEQCKLLYGSSAEDGSIECYNLNTQGTSDGHCGYDAAYDLYIPCSSENIMCGSLKCDAELQNLSITRNIVSTSFRKISPAMNCYSVTFDYGTIQNTPGMVPDGSPCGDDKVCKNGQCLSKNVLVTKECPKCHRGKCSNEGICVCDKDFTGVQCDVWKSNYTSQDGLIIGLFFLVLIIALVTAFLVYDCTHHNRLASFLNFRAKMSDETTIITNSPTTKPPQPPPANYKEIKKNEKKLNPQKPFRNKVMPSRPAPRPPYINHLFTTPINPISYDNRDLENNAHTNGGFNHQNKSNKKSTSNAQEEISRNKDYNNTTSNYRNPFTEALSNKLNHQNTKKLNGFNHQNKMNGSNQPNGNRPQNMRGTNNGLVLKFNGVGDNLGEKYKDNESYI